MFQLTAPLRPSFFPIVFAQGFVATLFFGWLPLYLPELFPTHVRATGSGISYNVGRFATAGGVLAAGLLFTAFGGSYPVRRHCRGTDLRPGHDGDLVGAGHHPQVAGLVNVAPTRPADYAFPRRHSMKHSIVSRLAGLPLLAAMAATVVLGQPARDPAAADRPARAEGGALCAGADGPQSQCDGVRCAAAGSSSARDRNIAIPSRTRPATPSSS